MPDWLTHTIAGWIAGKTTKMDIALVVIGSLIPDLVKINLAFIWLGMDHQHFFDPTHTPAGAFLIAGIGALFFEDSKKAFIPLGVGVTTHFILDFFLVHVSGGVKLLFPLSWEEWHYNIIRYDDYWVTIVAVVAALFISSIYWFCDKRKELNDN